MPRLPLGLIALLPVVLYSAAFADEVVRGIPLKADPPFAIDGDLADWAQVPNVIEYRAAEQVIHGRGAWAGPKDLSGTAWLSWRGDGLYLGAEVIDDVVEQSQKGDSIWKGDHLELYVDALPDLEPARKEFGDGQYQFAFSPGNFKSTGDKLTDCPPEAFVFRPRGASAEGIRTAARRTAGGYTIEALIPWPKMGLEQVSPGTPLRVELAISDTDATEARQESMMTSSTADWHHRRDRLNEAALAGTDGVARPRPRRLPITDTLTVERAKPQSLKFTAPATPTGRLAVLAFNARIEHTKVAGHTQVLKVFVNGQPVPGKLLLNKPARAGSRGGQVYSLYAGESLTAYYAPDFTSADRDPHYALVDGLKACEFELNVSELLKEGENELRFEHVQAAVERPVILGEVRLQFQFPPPPPKAKAPAPTGPIPTIEPAARHRTEYTVKDAGDGKLELTVGGESYTVASRFSTPGPGWVTGANPFFDYRRELDRRPEAVVVRETFTNKTAANLGIMQRHEVRRAVDRVWLSGLERPNKVGSVQEPHNPTVYAAMGPAGVGLVPLSDAMRVHLGSYCAEDGISIADNNLVLPPGASYTAEWAIVPTVGGDYWAFLNATRRLMEANFRLDGGFAFFRANAKLTEPWSDEQTRNFIVNKDAKYVCASIPYLGGYAAHGTAFQKVDLELYKRSFERRRRLVPGVVNMVYFHCFLDITEDGPDRFKDARLLLPDGQQGDYGQDRYKLYLPLADNSYGPAIAKNVDLILDEIGAEGVYWDEHEYSAYKYHYGEPWDRLSGDIDAQTGQVARLKSSVTLLTEPWRVALAKRILAKGPLIGNGSPVTRAMSALDFMCFVETGSITNCTRNHLYSPIALGDHLTERSEKDAYQVMVDALDYGCLYHWYNDLTVIPTHHHLTQYMYPITPVELGGGYVIGSDRIITNRSGLYGFGDGSTHEVHVYNDQGVEVPDFKAPLVKQDGKTYTELRIAEDWSAAVLRK